MVYLAFFPPLVFSYFSDRWRAAEIAFLLESEGYFIYHVQLFHETLHLHLQVNQQ